MTGPLASRLTWIDHGRSGALDQPLIMAVHGQDDTPDAMAAAARELMLDGRLVTPVGQWGKYVGAMGLAGYGWFQEAPGVHCPEPVSLGRALMELELLLAELEPDPDGRVVLLGSEQGATLSLALAMLIPDRLSAVVAVGGRAAGLPQALPGYSGRRLPVLWMDENHASDQAAADALAERTELESVTRAGPDPEALLVADDARRAIAWLRSHGIVAEGGA